MNIQMELKYEGLKDCISDLGSAAVCLSGGVDSSLLAYAAYEVLGNNSLAVTMDLHSTPARDAIEAEDLAASIGIPHVTLRINELREILGFAKNPPNRCYLCKRELLTRVWEIARTRGLANVIEGSNADDLRDWRPGMRAVEELGVKSPLAQARLTKADVRELARELDLWVWNRPSSPCLATRFPHGERITAVGLYAVDRAEDALQGLGYLNVRVRIHGNLARIEVERDDISQLIHDLSTKRMQDLFHDLGFAYVTVDPLGYRPSGAPYL